MHRRSLTTTTIIPIAWIAMGIFDAGFVNADFRARYQQLMQSPREAADTHSFAIGWSVASGPFGFILTPFFTGFYSSGWTLTRQPFPCTTDYPDIWCKP